MMSQPPRRLNREGLLQTLRQFQQQQQQELPQPADPTAAAGRRDSGSASRDASVRRTQQMMRRHLSARRARHRSELQVNLYRMLEDCCQQEQQQEQQNRHHEQEEVKKDPHKDLQRRQRLLKGLKMLNQLPLGGGGGGGCTDADNGAPQSLPKCSSNSATVVSSTMTTSGVEEKGASRTETARGSWVATELGRLDDSLRFLELACRVKQQQPPPPKQQQQQQQEPAACTTDKLTQRIGRIRGRVAGMLRRQQQGCGDGGGGGDDRGRCRFRGQAAGRRRKAATAEELGEPLFWRCQAHAALAKQQQERRQLQRQHRALGRHKASLKDDPIFCIDEASGKHYKWGKMTLPSVEPTVANKADQLGRANLHRSRVRQRKAAIRAEVAKFAEQTEAKWEAIEALRMDRAIDAACAGLRRAVESRKKEQKKQKKLQPRSAAAVSHSHHVPARGRCKSVELASNCQQNVIASDSSSSIYWGV